ncbi:hypothetical protein OG871_12800 [Kitasatospora sp. NBC_00374]|uniref:hypothetical protein n=1 Tax=Kitasatospora sp. NBC_00374 TaxID=2975964 RepID=UPI0030E01797
MNLAWVSAIRGRGEGQGERGGRAEHRRRRATGRTDATTDSSAVLASTGGGEGLPWELGGSVAALALGAGLVVAARRRTADER